MPLLSNLDSRHCYIYSLLVARLDAVPTPTIMPMTGGDVCDCLSTLADFDL